MYIYVARVKKRSFIQAFVVNAILKISGLKKQKGAISKKTIKTKQYLWRMELWDHKNSMVSVRRSPKHQHIFGMFKKLFGNIEMIHLEQEDIPEWDEISARMMDKHGGERQVFNIKQGKKKSKLRMMMLMPPLMIIFMVFIVPSPIDPDSWSPPVKPTEEGVLLPNTSLGQSVLLAKGDLDSPEDITFDKQGRLYTGTKDGFIHRLTFNMEGTVELTEKFAKTGGYPLGLHFDKNENLIVAVKEKGLYSIDSQGSVTLLTNQVADSRINYANNFAITSDGIIYFTDSSTKFDLGFPYDILESRSHGRLLSYDLETKQTQIILDNLYFANGVVLSPNEDYLLINETARYRITRYWLKGPQAGTTHIFADNLPILPDNISIDQDGDYWVGGMRRLNMIDFLQPRPFLKKQVAKIPLMILKQIPSKNKYGIILNLDSNGDVKQSLHDPSGHVYAVSSVIRRDNTLYIGSLFGDYIAKYTLPDNNSQL